MVCYGAGLYRTRLYSDQSIWHYGQRDVNIGIIFSLRLICQMLGSGHGAMDRAWVFQTRGPVFDSRRNTVVSGRASDLKCSCATLVQVCRSILILEIKNQGPDRVSQCIKTINERQLIWQMLLSQNLIGRLILSQEFSESIC